MPRKIVIDTDPGVDDVLAILLALASPEVEVALITPVFGNTHAPQTFANLLKLYYNLGLELEAHPEARERYAGVGRAKTLVAVGEDDPIGGDKHVATYFHGRDGLSNISETNPEFNVPDELATLAPGAEHPYLEVTDKKAADAILDLLRAEPAGSVTIVALGPLTNIAWAHRKDPEAFARVGEVVWMGGALDVPGNTSPVAEFNCFADPYAVEALIAGVKEGAFPFTFAPLDITTPHTISFTDLLHPGLVPGNNAADYPAPTRLEAFTTAFLLRVRWLQAKFGHADAMEMHDPLAIWYAIAHAGAHDKHGAWGARKGVDVHGWATAKREFSVERRGELTRGMCVVDRRGTGETTTDRTQDTELTTGNAHLQSNGTAAASNNKHEVEPMPKPAVHAVPAETCSCPTVPDLGPESCPVHSVYLPRMITHTPGAEELRKTLLGRVFGKQV